MVAVSGAELVDVIGKLRDDLEAAMGAGEGRRLKFELGSVEVTLSVSVTSTGGGKAGVRFWVIEAGSDGSVAREKAQEIKLTLNPKDTQTPIGTDKPLSSAFIHGEAAEDEA